MSKGNRKKAEEFILKYIKKITQSDANVELYKKLFKSMSDKEFHSLMLKIRDEGYILQVIAPVGNKKIANITLDNNHKVAKELGVKFEERLVYKKSDDEPKVKTQNKFVILKLPFRRTKQTIEKGVTVAEHDKDIDLVTGQPKGDSESVKLTYPEIQILNGMGLKHSVVEILKDRGGDLGSYKALKHSILNYGKADAKVVRNYSTSVMSGKTLKNYLLGMHLKSTLP